MESRITARATGKPTTVLVMAIVVVAVVALIGVENFIEISSNSSTSSEGTAVLVVSSTTLDRTTADTHPGYITYIFNLTITNRGSKGFPVTPGEFRAATETNSTYGDSFALAIRQPLRSVTLDPNESTTGQVSFAMPVNQFPTRVEFESSLPMVEAFTGSLPQSSQWVSTIDYANATLDGPHGGEYLIVTTIRHSVTFYYSTERMVLTVMLQAFVPNATGIRITSIAVSNHDFDVISVVPALPVSVPDDGTKVILTLSLSLPQESVDVQELGLTVSCS